MKYTAPTSTEVRQILTHFDLSGSDAAEQVGIGSSRTFRKYTAQHEALKMSYAVLFTLIAKNTGRFVSVDKWREVLFEERVLVQSKSNYMRG